MDNPRQKLKQNIEDKNGNLWESRGTNPYRLHPLLVLELDKQATVTAPMITASVQKLSGRQRAVAQTGVTTEAGAITPSRAKELLMRPETRVICELLRMPPVEVPKEDLDSLKQLAGELFRDAANLPWPNSIDCHWEKVAEVIFRFLATEESSLAAPVAVQPDFGAPLELPRQSFTGVSFRMRRKREG